MLMAGMTRTRPRPVTRARLREAAPSLGRPQVDRDGGVIRHVKVLGLESQNGRRYTAEALRKAVTLYEGAKVNVDHPARADDPRGCDEGFGRLVHVTLEEDGLYGDLEFLRSHPLADRVCEAAERMPDAYGLSHNIDGKIERIAGVPTVTEIERVHSVDLVRDPATTSGLFEGLTVKRVKIRAFLEGLLPRLSPARQGLLRRVLERSMDDLEQDGMDMDEPAAGPAEQSPEDALSSGFEASVMALVKAILAGEMDAAEGVGKIKDLIMSHQKLTAAAEPAEEQDDDYDEMDMKEQSDDDEEGDDDDDEEKPAAEGRRRKPLKGAEALAEVKRLKARLACRRLCERHRVSLSPTQMRALEGLARDADRVAFVLEVKRAANAAGAQRVK